MVRTNEINELLTGMYFQDQNGQWVESQEVITAHPSGAVGQLGQYQVILGNNLADPVDLLTPDGKRFKSHLIGLSYFDLSTGRSVLIAEVQNAVGELLPPNQVIYRNAGLGDVQFDVRYTYRRDSFHQDLILLSPGPPTPEEYGLNAATTQIEILTEFVESPALQESGPNTEHALDDEIHFGRMEFGYGRAFVLNDPTVPEAPVSRKKWEKMEGRQFLIEKLDYTVIAPLLATLAPAQVAAVGPRARPVLGRKLPLQRLAGGRREPVKLASLPYQGRGVNLDYTFLNTASDFTFKSSDTYYV